MCIHDQCYLSWFINLHADVICFVCKNNIYNRKGNIISFLYKKRHRYFRPILTNGNALTKKTLLNLFFIQV